ncbi:MAG: hypothetical protein CMG88_00160 [Marinobacter sp.]|jgi:hypothetical protein|uniref:Transposase, IS4 family protein n=2 Tax=Marinobacter TaxID=2742 RepID=G6YSZ6_9GAMM|nr:hypothetical protein AU15_21590 [Marinobacter salarius]EHJ04682.1 transposase, IS4 family protein [Marinobacter manganoxydans MnI7-9]MBP52963.1 hypothetical protein [Marinobacter sp.]|tara:strand:+ start:1377 stop:1574 length:198 start_codon:yes stop_codon:yes gene_type:complete
MRDQFSQCGAGVNLKMLAELFWPYENGRYLLLILTILCSDTAFPDGSAEAGELLVIRKQIFRRVD